MFNNINLIGRLTKDVDLKATETGKFRGYFQLAVARDFKNKEGNIDTDYFTCVVWGKSAELLTNFTTKGSMIRVGGKLRNNAYVDKEGIKHLSNDVIVSEFNTLETKQETESRRVKNNKNYSSTEKSSEDTHKERKTEEELVDYDTELVSSNIFEQNQDTSYPDIFS